MTDKLQWFEEVLAADPGSKLFLPYAKALIEAGENEKAVAVLQNNVQLHPEHAEARMMLVNLLYSMGRTDAAASFVQYFVKMVGDSPAFWSAMAEQKAKTNSDDALCLQLLSASAKGKPISFADIFRQGVNAVFGTGYAAAPVAQKPAVTESEPVVQSAHTQTMADLLFNQGDLHGALAIYKELFEKNPVDSYLSHRITEIENRLNPAPAPHVEAAQPIETHTQTTYTVVTHTVKTHEEEHHAEPTPEPAPESAPVSEPAPEPIPERVFMAAPEPEPEPAPAPEDGAKSAKSLLARLAERLEARAGK